MKQGFNKSPVALAVVAALGAGAFVATPNTATAAPTPGKYVAGDFHNHSTCSDGSISMQKLVKKATVTWSLDWFVQAGHGGNGNRNCTLTEDADLNTPAYTNAAATAVYPATGVGGPYTTWANSGVTPKGNSLSGGNMWRWQSIQEFQYPLAEYLNALKNVPLFMGMESVVSGHEHSSMSVITGQMPSAIDSQTLPSAPPYAAIGNANALAQWSYCFDRNDTDTSRGVTNQWDCSVAGSLNALDANWSSTAYKLTNNNGVAGHNKTLEALKWMAQNHGTGSYYVPAHLERAGPFNTAGANGFNVEHLRNMNNAAPNVAFGFESQPGHGASNNRGEYQLRRNNFGTGNFTLPNTTKVNVDSVGGTTYGGTGVYAGLVGGVWDALLGEGRNWWFFASSDWHNRGSFSADDVRSTQDFQPGEYQRNVTLVRNGSAKINPQMVVDGLRTGNTYAASGQLIDRLSFVACVSYPGITARSNASVETIALNAAVANTDLGTVSGCATMGQKLVVRPGAEIVVSVVVRDPAGTNNSPYSFNNPSLAQIGVSQPLNAPVLDHVDLIRGMVTGYKVPGASDYSGEWPRNTDWLDDGTGGNLGATAGLSVVPAAAKNTSAAVLRTWNTAGTSPWTSVSSGGSQYLKMTYRIPAVQASQYVRLRGTNLPASVPFETDASGNPLSDIFTNAQIPANLRIPCTVTGTNVPANNSTFTAAQGLIDGCPAHLTTAPAAVTGANGTIASGTKMVSYDVAAWADLWFYSNPIYVEVSGTTLVAGVK